jgi:hypothetical protein
MLIKTCSAQRYFYYKAVRESLFKTLSQLFSCAIFLRPIKVVQQTLVASGAHSAVCGGSRYAQNFLTMHFIKERMLI